MPLETGTATFTRFADGTVQVVPTGVGVDRLTEDEADALVDYLDDTAKELKDAQKAILHDRDAYQKAEAKNPTELDPEANPGSRTAEPPTGTLSKADQDAADLAIAGKDVVVPTADEQKAEDDRIKLEQDAAKDAQKAQDAADKETGGKDETKSSDPVKDEKAEAKAEAKAAKDSGTGEKSGGSGPAPETKS